MSQPLTIFRNELTMPAPPPALQKARANGLSKASATPKLSMAEPQSTKKLSFASMLNSKAGTEAVLNQLDPKIKQKMEKAANDFLSISLFQPLLKQMREDPFKTDMFHGGMAEDMFTERMDQVIASDLAKSSSGLFGKQIFEDFAKLALTNNANVKPPETPNASAAELKAKLP